MNSRVKTLWGTKPHVYLGNVAPGVAEVGSLFPARARFKFKSLKALVEDQLRKMCTRLQRELL